jgi:hypothetical protein
MTRIDLDSDQAHPLPGRDSESGGATLTMPCGTTDRSADAHRPESAARERIGRIHDAGEARSCAVSGEEPADRSDEGGEG